MSKAIVWKGALLNTLDNLLFFKIKNADQIIINGRPTQVRELKNKLHSFYSACAHMMLALLLRGKTCRLSTDA